MAEMNTVGGKFRLTRSNSISRLDDGSIRFIVQFTTDSASGFVGPVQNYSPGYVFVKINSDFQRIATLDDYLGVPAIHPDTPGGEYRDNKVVREFSDVAQALAWTRSVYDTVNALIITVKDYTTVFEDTTEEVWVPDTMANDLYSRISSYLLIVDEYADYASKLEIARAKKIVLDLVYSAAMLEDPDNTSGGAIDVLRQTLPQLNRLLLSMTTFIEDIPIDFVEQIKGILQVDISSNNENITNYAGLIKAEADAPDLVDPGVSFTKISAWAISIQTASSSDNTLIAQAVSLLASFLKTLDKYGAGVQLLTNVLEASGVVAPDTVNAIEKLNIARGVNSSELYRLQRQLDKDIEAYEQKVEDTVKLKQEKLAYAKLLYPNLDPTDPMKVFNYRVFLTPDAS